MIKFCLLLLCLSLADASLKVTRTSQDGRHPTAMEVEVQLPPTSKPVRIPLKRNDAYEDMPVTVKQNGTSRTFSARQLHHEGHAHYNDIESKSVLSVREVNGQKRFAGHVTHEGRTYFVEPMKEGHKVRANPITPEQLMQQHEQKKMMKQVREAVSRKRRQINSDSTTNVIEVAVCLDSTVYAAFNALYNTSAMTEIHYYYTHIMNGVDVAYRNIDQFSVSVRSISLTVSTSAADDAWMPAQSVSNRLEGSVILQSLVNYIQTLNPKPDHVMAFTRLDITGGGSSSVCGMAYLSGACTNNGVSINEDEGLHSWGTAAHELAHNMGSSHDGSSSSPGCSATVHNIMAPSSTFYTLSNVANSYHFSPCSIQLMKQYVQSLGSSSCLAASVGSQVSDLANIESTGLRISLDQVCQVAYSDSSRKFFLSNEAQQNPATICAGIFCSTPSGGGTAKAGMRAVPGTPCGSQKSCNQQGSCTDDTNAPVTPAGCFWGDTFSAASCNQWVNVVKVPDYKAHYCGYVKANCCKSVGNECD